MIDDNWMTNIPDMGATMRAMEDARRADLDRQARNSGRYDAEDIFKHLMQRVRAFQAALDEDQVS